MGSQAKNNLQICLRARANRWKERGGGGEEVGGRWASFSSTALIRTFRVNCRSVSVKYLEERRKKEGKEEEKRRRKEGKEEEERRKE